MLRTRQNIGSSHSRDDSRRAINAARLWAKDEGKRQMENLAQLHAKLDRTQAEIDRGIGHLIKQRARVAQRLGSSEDITQFRELLTTLEDTQLLHVQHRDRLRRKLDWMLAGNEATSSAIPSVRRVTVSHALLG